MKILWKKNVLTALSIAALALNLHGIPQTQGGSFLGNAPMITPRAGHVAILLRDGKVLVAGGRGNFKEGVDDPKLASGGYYDNATGKLILTTSRLNSAELYDPAAGSWTATGSMIHPCSWPKAVLLADGRVFVSLSEVGDGPRYAPEIYDPATGKWVETAEPAEARYPACTALLANGTVLVAQKFGNPPADPPVEWFNPADGTWTSASAMKTEFESPTATLLRNGEVLVTGVNGQGYLVQQSDPEMENRPVPANAELFHPATGRWTTITNSMTRHVNSPHTATLLSNGKVLFVVQEQPGTASHHPPQIFDPASGRWSVTGDMVERRVGCTATLLPDGKVLVAGGDWNGDGLSSAEWYDPETGKWGKVPSHLATARWGHTATLLPDGRVLIAGGTYIASTELYDPGETSPTR
ncbi:MAG TPA: kelch repeat-containing protein [Verrucomicrobiae bacterium]|nr:kelch repeat-containing protein [Verrucomicrobiae bacterium]